MEARFIDKSELKDSCRKLLACLGIGLLSVVMFTLLSSPLKAQSLYGSVVGTVTDASGAIVPGAAVTLINIGTNEKRTAQTDAAGDYRFVDLLPANYRLEVERASFKRLTRELINVQVGSEVRINATLEVGATTETVQVTSRTPLLQTESGTQSSVVEGEVVQEMPLNGRNTMNLLALTPGVVPQGGTAGSSSLNRGNHTDVVGFGNYQIGGGIAGQGAMYIDGAPINVLIANQVGLIPTQDSVQEFRVATNAVSAEFGRFAGGVVEMSTKSGSNAWHGSAYEYLRNTILNASDFISNSKGVVRPPYHEDQYGVLATGPIKKDKAFFLFSWEDLHILYGTPIQTNVATAAMKAGKFYGKTLKASMAPAGCITNGLSDSGGTYAQVNSSCFDPTAQVITQYYPPPNSTVSGFNFFNEPKIGNDTFQYVARIDYNLSAKQRLFGRYTYWNLTDKPASNFNNYNGFATAGAAQVVKTHSVVLGDSYVFSPTTVLDIRASYLNNYVGNVPPAGDFNINESMFGPAYAAMAPSMTFRLLVVPTFSGSDSLANTGGEVIAMDVMSNLAFDANVTKLIRRHTLKFGGEFRYMDHSGFGTNHNPSSLGTFSSATLGDEYAAFLLGEFLTDLIQTDAITDTFNYSQGYYVNDTWQVGRSLTLNLGVRWELPGGLAEKKDRTTVLLPNTVDPVTGLLGSVALTNSSEYPSRSMEPERHDLFSPRIGFAQRLGNATVIRGGYGLNYLSPDLPFGVMAYNAPLNAAVTTNSVGGYHALSDPFGVLSGGKINLPVGHNNPTFINQLLNQVVTGAVPTTSYPYLQQWNLDLGRQWKGDWLTEVSYVGAKGTHLVESGAYDPNDYTYMGLDELSSQYYPTLQAMENAGETTAQIRAYGQSLRPYPQFQNYVNTANYTGATIYHALYFDGEKRFRAGGVLRANYAWSKMIGNTDSTHWGPDKGDGGPWGFIQDYNNMKAERSLSAYDIRQRLVIGYVLNLPFGKGQRFANFSGVGDALVSGWSLNGLTTFQTGRQIGLYYNNNYLSNYFGAGTIRPNYIPGCQKTVSGKPEQRLKGWFNAACFTYPGDFAFGNEPRVDPVLRAQGIRNYDLALQKVVKIKERVDLQMRFESFNLFNTPRFAAPGVIMGGSNYDIVTSQANQPRLNQASLRLTF